MTDWSTMEAVKPTIDERLHALTESVELLRGTVHETSDAVRELTVSTKALQNTVEAHEREFAAQRETMKQEFAAHREAIRAHQAEFAAHRDAILAQQQMITVQQQDSATQRVDVAGLSATVTRLTNMMEPILASIRALTDGIKSHDGRITRLEEGLT